MKHVSLHFIVLVLLYGTADAQQRKKDTIPAKRTFTKTIRTEISPYSLTLRAGLTQFFGELNEQNMQGSFGIGLDRKLNKSVSLGLDYTAGKVGGQKTELFNSYFINEYNTAEILIKWNLTEQFTHQKSQLCNISVYGGLGLMFFNAHTYDLTTNELLRFTNSESSKRNQFFLRWGNPHGRSGINKTREGIIPVGTSLDYCLSEKWRISMDYRFYFIRTDKADATSGQRLINPEEEDSYSGTPNDKFSLLSVSITHSFAKPRKH
ncbi:hypothetical protein [Dyadobacter sp. NIV53]|uniref:hypothetical protein n=1 Tax=Dyadobacter sp. NIV53 TaxID=2861765 RepID=UPI001C872FB6|nr:hypothetical protein [Dyadobacter sp. NIV53]